MAPLSLVCAALVGVSAAYHAASVICALQWKRRAGAQPQAPDSALPYLPGVTILKPLRGVDPGHEENLRSFCELDYPHHQVIFAALDPDDPGLEAARRLQRKLPQRDIAVVAGGEARGQNKKVSTLLTMLPNARHEIYVIADSDMRVTPDYLRAVVAPLSDPAVGLVTCPYRGACPRGPAAWMEALAIGTDFMPGAFVAYQAFGIRFAFGSTIAIRKSVLEEIGGLESLADALADDFALADRTHGAGYDVALSRYVVDDMLGAEPFRSVWRRRLRWAKTSRAMRRGPYYALFITYLTPLAALYAASVAFSSSGWAVLAAAIAFRICSATAIARFVTGDRSVLRLLPLVPASELMCSAIWLLSLLNRRIHWRGEQFVIRPDGSMEPGQRQ